MAANGTALEKQMQVHVLEIWSALIVQTSVCLVGAALNILNVIIFQKIHSDATPYVYMTALAFADAGTLLVHLPYGLTRCEARIPICSTSLAKHLRSYLSYYITYVGFGLGNIFEAMSAWITVLICIERYVTMQWPHLSKSSFSRSLAMIQILGAVIVAIVFHLPMFFTLKIVGQEKVTPDNVTHRYQKTVLTEFGQSIHYYSYTWIRFTLVQCLPLLLLCVVNVLLLVLIWSSYSRQKSYAIQNAPFEQKFRETLLQKMKQNRLEVESRANVNGADNFLSVKSQTLKDTEHFDNSLQTSTNDVSAPQAPVRLSGRLDRKQQANNKLTILLVTVIFLFLIGQIPQAFSYTHIIRHFAPRSPESYAHISLYRHLSQLVCLITSTANFFLYIALNRCFRECIFRSFKCC